VVTSGRLKLYSFRTRLYPLIPLFVCGTGACQEIVEDLAERVETRTFLGGDGFGGTTHIYSHT